MNCGKCRIKVTLNTHQKDPNGKISADLLYWNVESNKNNHLKSIPNIGVTSKIVVPQTTIGKITRPVELIPYLGINVWSHKESIQTV